MRTGNIARLCAALLILWFGLTLQANALVTLDIQPNFTSVDVGQRVDVDVVVDPDGALVGAFDVSVAFDPSLLDFMASTVDPEGALGFALDDQLESSGAINVAAVSLAFDLTPFQDGSAFTLFSLTFNALDVGVSALELTPGALAIGVFLSDELGFELPVDAVRGGTVEIRPAQIPEPGVLALFVIALGAMGAAARRRARLAR